MKKIYYALILLIILISSLIWTEFIVNREVIDEGVLITDLVIPWSLDFMGEMVVLTERVGNVSFYNDSELVYEKVIPSVHSSGEGGLLGVAVKDSFVYLYYTYQENNEVLNKVVRYLWTGSELIFNQTIIDSLPGALIHNGGRIKFGPDGLLYITTGDAANEQLAQDLNSLAGKILRLNPDGSIPVDNPFSDPIFSYGHRNPQGLAWDIEGQLWVTEHGSSATDELNKIVSGGNYGWPIIKGSQEKEGMTAPVIQSGSTTWAPSGATYHNSSIYFTGLRGQAVYEYRNGELFTHYEKSFGRLRTIVSHEGRLYVLTNNRDGRGVPLEGDDKLVMI